MKKITSTTLTSTTLTSTTLRAGASMILISALLTSTILIAGLFSSCKKNNDGTSSYKNSLSLAATGINWSPATVSATVNTASNAIVISASDGGSQKMDIYISKDINAGTELKIYTTSTVPAGSDLLTAHCSIGSFTVNAKIFTDWAKATLKITEHDKTNRILKASFTGGSVLFSDSSIPLITGGGFDIKY